MLEKSFKLDEAIANWRNQIAAQGLKSREVLDELESHLREAMERRIRAGEEASKAFELATREIGEASALRKEFAKANTTRSAVEKLMLAACVVLMAFIVFLGAAAVVLCFTSLTDRIVSGAGMVATLMAACFWSRAVPFLPTITDKRVRIFLSLSCILAGIGFATFYCQVILQRFGQPYDHQIAAAGFWMLLPVAAGLGLGCGLDLAGHKHLARMA
jgi:hypothetical protein